MKKRTKKNNKGFTLIELLIIIIIIGILASVSIPAYIGMQEKARKSILEKAAVSAEEDIEHWLKAAVKGAFAGTDNAHSREADTNGDGMITDLDMTNAALFNDQGSANASVASVYASSRAEFSPWVNMGACGSTTALFTYIPVDPGPGNRGVPCTVQLSPAAGSSGKQVVIIATTNGPGGYETEKAELLSRNVVEAE